MQLETIQATISLKKAHKKLAEELNREFNLEELAVQLNNFYKDVDMLNKSVQAIGK
jgi:hypothetical protein